MTIPNVLDIAIVPIWKFRNFDFWGEDNDGEPVRSIKCSTCANLNVNLYTCWNLKGWNCVLLRVLIIREENNESLDIFSILSWPQNRDYNRSPTSVGTFDVNGAAHVAWRILAAILLASKNGEFDIVLLGSSLQKLDYQWRYRFQS